MTFTTTGTLKGLTKLRNVGLGSNHLQELAADSVQCNSNTGLVDLGYNQLKTVHPNAFPGERKRRESEDRGRRVLSKGKV